MKFTDTAELAGTRRDADGNLIAEAFAVRTGVQVYRGSEVGLADREVVHVLRPESEVRDPESMKTFTHATVTMDHPSEMVTPENWKGLAKGEVSTEATWDGNKIKLPLIIKDAAAIKAIEGGKRELSAGYTCALDWTAGTTEDGQAYDAVQREIRINHLAIVDRGRAGAECRIGDADHWGAGPLSTADMKGSQMADNLRNIMVDGLSVSTTDAGAQAIEKLNQKLSDGAKALADAEAAHKEALEAKDEEIGTLKADKKALEDAAMTPEKMTKIIADRVALEATVKAISDSVVVAGISDADLRKAVVASKLGDEMVADESEASISGMFKAIAKDAAVDPLKTEIKQRVADGDDAWGAKVFDSAGIKMKKEA